MDIETHTNIEGTFIPPPLVITPEERKIMSPGKRAVPFSKGDVVIPLLIPVDSEDRGRRFKITAATPLIIETIMNRGETYLVTLQAKHGKYDACFFKKV